MAKRFELAFFDYVGTIHGAPALWAALTVLTDAELEALPEHKEASALVKLLAIEQLRLRVNVKADYEHWRITGKAALAFPVPQLTGFV